MEFVFSIWLLSMGITHTVDDATSRKFAYDLACLGYTNNSLFLPEYTLFKNQFINNFIMLVPGINFICALINNRHYQINRKKAVELYISQGSCQPLSNDEQLNFLYEQTREKVETCEVMSRIEFVEKDGYMYAYIIDTNRRQATLVFNEQPIIQVCRDQINKEKFFFKLMDVENARRYILKWLYEEAFKKEDVLTKKQSSN